MIGCLFSPPPVAGGRDENEGIRFYRVVLKINKIHSIPLCDQKDDVKIIPARLVPFSDQEMMILNSKNLKRDGVIFGETENEYRKHGHIKTLRVTV